MKWSKVWLTALLMLHAVIGSVHAKAINIGDIAPNFTIMTTSHEVFKLSDHIGKKPIYLIFWNTWCPYCVKKMPRYQETHTFHGEDITVLAINTAKNDKFENIGTFVQRHQLELPMAYDFGSKISKRYGVIGTPTAFIIDINGRIRHQNDVPEDIESHIEQWRKPAG
jgi:peroxiredoxin